MQLPDIRGARRFPAERETRDVIFTGDAAKNRAEMLSRTADMTYDPAVSRTSMEAIWTLWRAKPGSILIPGHDAPMLLGRGRAESTSPH